MAIILKRQISDNEKEQIIQKHGRKCFATGHDIGENESVHFDHIKAFASGGATDITNIAPMCQSHNQQKGQLPLYDFRIKLQIDEFFDRGDTLTLQHELEFLKEKKAIDGYGENVHFKTDETKKSIEIEIKNKKSAYPLYKCVTTGWRFFYAVLPVDVINSDDDNKDGAGLQPRYLIRNKVFELFRHFQNKPVLQPSLCRISNNKILTFDGQHKIASLLWNDKKEFECKVYINPDLRILNDTNISAHDKYSQTRFFSSIMVARLGEGFGKDFEEYRNQETREAKSESGFFNYLKTNSQMTGADANKRFRSWLYNQVLGDGNKISKFVSKSNRRTEEAPITMDMLEKSIFKFMYKFPTEDDLTSEHYKREYEVDNMRKICGLLVDHALNSWDENEKTSPNQIKLKRIFGSKSMMAWAGLLKGSICGKLELYNDSDRERVFYRKISDQDFDKISHIIRRLVEWNMWDLPAHVAEIDTHLSGNRVDVEKYFEAKGLTTGYLMGASV